MLDVMNDKEESVFRILPYLLSSLFVEFSNCIPLGSSSVESAYDPGFSNANAQILISPLSLSSVQSASGATLSWNFSELPAYGSVTYIIFRSTLSGFETLLSNVVGKTFFGSEAASGKSFFYKVSAINSVSQSPVSSEYLLNSSFGTNSIFCSGMETPNFADWGSMSSFSSTISLSSSNPAQGAFSMQLTGDGADNRAWVTIPSFSPLVINTSYYIRVYAYIPSGSLNASGVLKFLTSSTSDQFDIIWNGSSIPGFSYVGPGGLYITTFPSNLMTLDSWHCLEIQYVVSSSSGGVSASIDGTNIGSSFASGTSGDVGLSAFNLGNGAYGNIIAAGGKIFFDDFQISSAPMGCY